MTIVVMPLHYSVKARVRGYAGQSAPFCYWFPCDFMKVCREIYRRRGRDITADAEPADRNFLFDKKTYLGDVETAAYKDADMMETLDVEFGPQFLHEVGGDAASFPGCVQPYCGEFFTECPGDPEAFFDFVFEGIDKNDSGNVGGHVFVKGKACLHRVPDHEDKGMGHGA